MQKAYELNEDTLQGRKVIFKAHPTGEPNYEALTEGDVLYVRHERRIVCVCYLYGFKSLSDEVSYDDLLAIIDPAGEHMEIGNYAGRFIDLRKAA
ncbi:MAG TPA: hypothetical protein VFY28_01100 [Candidatus Paceibacterota bacterium]|nr:hypothetical protein [Candidatus Paceibacterota bacterium]